MRDHSVDVRDPASSWAITNDREEHFAALSRQGRTKALNTSLRDVFRALGRTSEGKLALSCEMAPHFNGNGASRMLNLNARSHLFLLSRIRSIQRESTVESPYNEIAQLFVI
ncbi:hypothetical protein AVEN_169360-1 [Araneus ventricosus]|uniref:Uncharacterized protein n=1 Tax=Araneus ventricosus TaxID=182803 RepID=A0A4Y2T1K2_ARAVE|nr:hypothetical protein AVEN_169360-1 [Araneus ventricosus]